MPLKQHQEWPAEVSIPKSPVEARKLGWNNGEVTLNLDNETGVAKFWKRRDDLFLEVFFPVVAKLTFGSPKVSASMIGEEPVKEKRKSLFDVEFCGPDGQIIRVLAEDECAACDIVLDHCEFGVSPVPADKKKRRVVYEWRPHQGLVSVKTGKKLKKLRSRR
jgi:hypothetical protein